MPITATTDDPSRWPIDRIQFSGGVSEFIYGNESRKFGDLGPLLAAEIPFIEVHISNIFAREEFRRQSYLSDRAVGVISGLGVQGYGLALRAADQLLKSKKKK